jgi:hypothetical protein
VRVCICVCVCACVRVCVRMCVCVCVCVRRPCTSWAADSLFAGWRPAGEPPRTEIKSTLSRYKL